MPVQSASTDRGQITPAHAFSFCTPADPAEAPTIPMIPCMPATLLAAVMSIPGATPAAARTRSSGPRDQCQPPPKPTWAIARRAPHGRIGPCSGNSAPPSITRIAVITPRNGWSQANPASSALLRLRCGQSSWHPVLSALPRRAQTLHHPHNVSRPHKRPPQHC